MKSQVFPVIVAILGVFSVVLTFLEVSQVWECLDVGGREARGLPAVLEWVFVMVTGDQKASRIVVGIENFVITNSPYAVSKVPCAVKFSWK